MLPGDLNTGQKERDFVEEVTCEQNLEEDGSVKSRNLVCVLGGWGVAV